MRYSTVGVISLIAMGRPDCAPSQAPRALRACLGQSPGRRPLEGGLQQAQQNGTLLRLGPAEEAGEVSRLAPLPALPWKNRLSWTPLVAKALVTARMAFNLYRATNNQQST
jgi:hypothetical protein